MRNHQRCHPHLILTPYHRDQVFWTGSNANSQVSPETPGAVLQHVPGTRKVIVQFEGVNAVTVPRDTLQTAGERQQRLAALGLEPNQVGECMAEWNEIE